MKCFFVYICAWRFEVRNTNITYNIYLDMGGVNKKMCVCFCSFAGVCWCILAVVKELVHALEWDEAQAPNSKKINEARMG